jgi:dihydrofolate reductase
VRKLVVLSFISLDGVMQAPGGPEEDVSGDFHYGGWAHPYFDECMGEMMAEQMGRPFDLLLGRKTYELFASYWPNQDDTSTPGAEALNKARKYVVSGGHIDLSWEGSVRVAGDIAVEVQKLKKQSGPTLQVHGSGNLVQTLLKYDLVDELWLKIFPVTLGLGKHLFGEGTIPAAFKLLQSAASPSGVLIASYARSGDIKLACLLN